MYDFLLLKTQMSSLTGRTSSLPNLLQNGREEHRNPSSSVFFNKHSLKPETSQLARTKICFRPEYPCWVHYALKGATAHVQDL